MNSAGNAITSRRMLFSNEDVNISKCHANESMKTIYKNAYADELLFISSGEGVLETNFGKLNLIFGDYIVIPRGVIWRIKVLSPLKILIIESHGPIESP